MKLAELAEKLACELRGDGGVEIDAVAPIENAAAGTITFVANPRYARYLRATQASAVILARDAAEVSIASLRTDNPYLAFARAIDLFHRPLPWPSGIHSTAVIAASAVLGRNCSIGPYAVIGDGVRIGDDARIAAHVVIYPHTTIGERFTAHAQVTVREECVIGNNVCLHAGAVIGSDGFGYAAGPGGQIAKITQAGNVILEDDVEIGANATVDRAAVGSTVIHRSAKLDNLVLVAHGCEIGEGSMLAGQTGLSGSTQIGRYVRIGGQVGSAGHLRVGDGAQVAAQSGIHGSVESGTTVGGTPAVEIGTWRRYTSLWNRLPELFRRVRKLERQLNGDA